MAKEVAMPESDGDRIFISCLVYLKAFYTAASWNLIAIVVEGLCTN